MKEKSGSKRPLSSCITGSNNLRRHIPINCQLISNNNPQIKIDNQELPQSKIYTKSQNCIFNQNNKNYNVNQNTYISKYNSQTKRKNMYNEMWNCSVNDRDYYGLSEAIKVKCEQRPKNKNITNLRSITMNSRISSAATYCDIGYISKRLIKGPYSALSNTVNLNTFNKSKAKNNIDKTNAITSTNQNFPSFANTDNIIEKEKFYKLNTNKVSNFANTEFYGVSEINDNNNNSELFSNNSSLININSSYKNIQKTNNKINNNPDNSTNKNNELIKLEKLKKKINECDTETLKLRTEYLIKYSKINDSYKKLNQVLDCFRVDFKDLYSSTLNSLSRTFDKCYNFLLNEMKTGEFINMENWSSFVLYLYNFCYQVLKSQNCLADELHFMKNEILNLQQKLFSRDNELTTKNKEISDINKYILKYDLTNKIKFGKKKEKSVNQVKQKYNQQESTYILTIYKLEEEIKHLTLVLEKNKSDLNKYEEMKIQLKNLENEYQNETKRLEHQGAEKEVNVKLLRQSVIDLNDQIVELESIIQEYKNKEELSQKKEIEYEAKISNLNRILKEKNAIIEKNEKEMEKYKEKKTSGSKMLEPVDTIFMPMKE